MAVYIHRQDINVYQLVLQMKGFRLIKVSQNLSIDSQGVQKNECYGNYMACACMHIYERTNMKYS